MWEFPGLKWKLILTNHLNKHDPTKKYKYVSYIVCVSMIFFHSSGSKQIHGAENERMAHMVKGEGRRRIFVLKRGKDQFWCFEYCNKRWVYWGEKNVAKRKRLIRWLLIHLPKWVELTRIHKFIFLCVLIKMTNVGYF